MARGITQAQVNDAADALLQRGQRPTLDKLRAELGTGSPNTITRMVDVWWAGLAERLAAQARADLPGLPEAVQRAMQIVWSEATVAARSAADTRVLGREQQVVAKERAAEAQLAEMTTALASAQNGLVAAEHTLAEERRRSAELQAALSDAFRSLKDTQATLDGVRHTGDEERARLRADLERAVAAEARWLRELDRAREEAKAAVREAKVVHAALIREKAQRQRLTRDLVIEKRNSQARVAAAKLARTRDVSTRKPPRRRASRSRNATTAG